MKTPAVFDFGAIRADKSDQPGAADDPVLDLARQLDEAIAAQRDGSEASRRVEAEYPNDAVLKIESAALDLDDDAVTEIGEEATATILAIYRERCRRDRIRWALDEKLMKTRATTLAGARIQLAWMLAQLKEGMDLDPEELEPVIDSLRAIAEREAQR